MAKKQRIEWIDELKGIAMLSVVSGHIMLGSFRLSSDDVLAKLVASYEMPLFFFLSGIVLSKVGDLRKLANKALQFLCPFFLVGSLYAYAIGGGFVPFMESGMKYGYWYLPVLTVFYIFNYLTEKVCPRGGYFTVLAPLAVYGLWQLILRVCPNNLSTLLCVPLWGYWPFFILGVVFRRFDLTEKLGKYQWLTSVLFLYFVVTFILFQLKGYVFHIFTLTWFAGVMFIVLAYKKAHKAMPLILTSQLRLIGRNTIDVYIYHYFIMAAISLPEVGKWLVDTNNWLLKLLLTLSVSLFTAYIAIFIGKFVRHLSISKIVYGKFIR